MAIDEYDEDEGRSMDAETEPFSDAELRERLVNPSGPEDWSDVIAALADRLNTSLADRRPEVPIDAAAIVRNFSEAIANMYVIVEGFVGDYEHQAEDWAKIRTHLNEATRGLDWIANAWI